MGNLPRIPGIDYNDNLLNIIKTQRRLEKKLNDLSDSDLEVGKIAAPTIKSDGSIQIPTGGFKKQKAKVDTGENAPLTPSLAGKIPNVDQQLSTQWRMNPYVIKDGQVDESKDLVPQLGRQVFIFAIIKKLDSASPAQTVIKLLKHKIKLYNRQILEIQKPLIQFQSSNEIQIGQTMDFKINILGGAFGETYTVKFQKIDKETNKMSGEVFLIGTGDSFDVQITASQVSRLFGYKRESIDLSFGVYDSNGILVTDKRVEIKTKLPQTTSQQLKCVTFKNFACYTGSDMSYIADQDANSVPVVTKKSDISCIPVITTEDCNQGTFTNLQVSQVIARTHRNIQHEYWKKGLNDSPDNECKERPIICSSDIQVIQDGNITKGQVKVVKCKDIYNSQELLNATARNDSNGKLYYRAQARSDESEDEKMYKATERKEKVIDKQKTQGRPSCYVLDPEKPSILGPNSPCAKLGDPALSQSKTEANCPISKKCYDLFVSPFKDIRDDADCRKSLQDWADSFEKQLSFQDQYESQNKLNDKFEQAFDEELPYFLKIKGEWFAQDSQYLDFFLKVILNDDKNSYTLNSPVRIFVAKQTPPLKDDWVEFKKKLIPKIVYWGTSFIYSPAGLTNISNDLVLSDTSGYKIIAQMPNADRDKFEKISASSIGGLVDIPFFQVFSVYKISKQYNDFGDRPLIDVNKDTQAIKSVIPDDLSDFNRKLYQIKIAENTYNPQELYGDKIQMIRYIRLLLQYPNGFTVSTHLKIFISPRPGPSTLPVGCTIPITVTVKYDNKDLEKRNSGGKAILSAQRLSAFGIGVDLSSCWTGYKVQAIELRDYDDLNTEKKLRNIVHKDIGYCKIASIGCQAIRGMGVECFDLNSNKVTQRTDGSTKFYEDDQKQCYIKDLANKHPIEQNENSVCVTTGQDCKYVKRCMYDAQLFKTQKCLPYRKMVNFQFEHRQTPAKNTATVTVQQRTVQSLLNKKLGNARLQTSTVPMQLFVDKFEDDIQIDGNQSLTFHIILTKDSGDLVHYLKKTIVYNIWKPFGVPKFEMSNTARYGTIFRDWGRDCDFQVITTKQDPTLKLKIKPDINRKIKSEDKFDNGESKLGNLTALQSLNKLECFNMFGADAKRSGAIMNIDVFNNLDRVGEQVYDIILKGPQKSQIKGACSTNKPTIEILPDQIGSDGTITRKTALTKTGSKYQIDLNNYTNLVVKVKKNAACSTYDNFKINLSFSDDLFREQCFYNDPKCKELGDCQKLSTISCLASKCTIQGEKKKLAQMSENDKDGNAFKRVNGQFDCYVEVKDGATPFKPLKTYPNDRPKFDIPFVEGPNAGEVQILAESSAFLKRVLKGDVTLYPHVFQYDNTSYLDYYQTDPIELRFKQPQIQIQEFEKSFNHPVNKDVFIRPICVKPGDDQAILSIKYICPSEINQRVCNQSKGKNLRIDKSQLISISGQKTFQIICEEKAAGKDKTQQVKITFVKIAHCPKFQLIPEQIEINDQKLKKLDSLTDLFKLKIKIDKTACKSATLTSVVFTGSDSIADALKPDDDRSLGGKDIIQITKTYTKEQLLKVQYNSKHTIEATLDVGGILTTKGFLKIVRGPAQLKGRANGANRIAYKGDQFSFDVQIIDPSLEPGTQGDYETEIQCPNWISQEICAQIPAKNYLLDQRVTQLIPNDQIGKPQKFVFKIYAQDGREISIPASVTLLEPQKKSENLPQVVIRLQSQDSKFAKYGETFFYVIALNSQTRQEELIDFDTWSLSWRFLKSQDNQEVLNIDKYQFADALTVNLKNLRGAGSKRYTAELTLIRKSDGFQFKTSKEIVTAPPLKQGKVSVQQKIKTGKAKRFTISLQEYENIEYFEIRCVKKGKDVNDLQSVTKKFVSQTGAFEDISLPNSDDNDCYNIAKDTNGNVLSQKIQYIMAKKSFADKTQALSYIQVDNMEQLLENPFFETASEEDKGDMYKDMSQMLDTDFQERKGLDGFIPKAETGDSINSLKSFVKSLDIKQGSVNKDKIQSKTLSSFELVANSAINAIGTLTETDLQNVFEVIFQMEEKLSLSEEARSKAKSKKHEMIRLKLNNARQGQVQKIQTPSSKMVYSQFTPSKIKQTVEFQTSEQDPKVKIQPDTIAQIASEISVSKVNCIATSSNTMPSEIQTDKDGKELEFPVKKIQNLEITSQNGKEVQVKNLPAGKEVKIEFPKMDFKPDTKCQANFINEKTGKLDQSGVKCQYDPVKKLPTIYSTHLTSFTITSLTITSTPKPEPKPTPTQSTPNPTPTPPTPSQIITESSSQESGLSMAAFIGIIIGSAIILIGLIILVVFLIKKSRVKTNYSVKRSVVMQEDAGTTTKRIR